MDHLSDKEIIRWPNGDGGEVDERRPSSYKIRRRDRYARETTANTKTVCPRLERRGRRETDRQNEERSGRLPSPEQDSILRPVLRMPKLHPQSQRKSGLQRPASSSRIDPEMDCIPFFETILNLIVQGF